MYASSHSSSAICVQSHVGFLVYQIEVLGFANRRINVGLPNATQDNFKLVSEH